MSGLQGNKKLEKESSRQLGRLQQIVRTLRGPQGCAWDREQNYHSIRSDLIEECYEVVEAVTSGNFEDLKEELGDLLFLVFFYVAMAEEEGRFTISDIAKEVADKLVRRHPHVFAGQKVSGVDEIVKNWEEIKAAEKRQKKNWTAKTDGAKTDTTKIDGAKTDGAKIDIDQVDIDQSFHSYPALLRALFIQKEAAKKGFDWVRPEAVLGKIDEELGELRAEIESPQVVEERIAEELGDLLFTVVNLARKLQIDPELTLRAASNKFAHRFRRMEQIATDKGHSLDQYRAEQLEELWLTARSLKN